ncbi:D-glycerate dehydrogenase [Kocuria palustris]|uniref:2-hydroxyacid dehydrogenase n=1 Tax=Kocuria palustris TaxID=71999 RepID=UPI0011AAF75B|nr:D-glycerate dehydrogenase [Kocuria palustris]
MPSFLCTFNVPGPAVEMLREAGEVDVVEGISREDFEAAVTGGEYDAVIQQLSQKVDADLMARATVKGFANFGVGFNNFDVDAATEHGLLIGNTPDVVSDPTANIAMLLLLGAARRAYEMQQLVRDSGGRFQPLQPDEMLSEDVSGTRLGIVGLGRIGKAMARRALGFGMEVVFVQRAPEDREVSDEELGDLAGRVRQVPFQELIETSDHISLHVPLAEGTEHLIGEAELRAMKSTAVLVNTARGPVVDEKALVAALREGEISAAGLDVFEDEPELAPGLVDLPNAYLLPHVGSAEKSARARMGEMCAENALAIARGDVPPYPVNPEAKKG